MPAAPIPYNEELRLAAVRDLDALDTPPEPELDRLTALVARILEVPICLISLVDEHRAYFLSHHGTDRTECGRQEGLCGHVVATGRPLVAHDLRLDERLADLDLVTCGVPPLRFGAGVPLLSNDQVIGTLSVFDEHPRRDFDEHRLRQLLHFGEVVQDQLHQRRERLRTQRERSLFSAGPVGAIVWDEQTPPVPTYLSTNLPDILGPELAAEVLAGQPLDSIVHPEDQDTLRIGLSSHQMGRLPSLEISYRLRPTGRRPRWIHQVSHGDYDEHGRLLRIRSYLLNVTRQKQLESAIEATKERLYLALESARIGTWDLNYPTQERVVNARTATMLGYREDELDHSQTSWTDLIHPYDRIRVEQAVREHLGHASDVLMVEYRMRHKKGHYIWVQSHGRTVARDADGRPLRMVGTLLDITDQKRQEHLRNLQRQLLDLLNQAQTTFLLNRNVQDACEALFEPLLRISDSTFGFIGIVQHPAGSTPTLAIQAMSHRPPRGLPTQAPQAENPEAPLLEIALDQLGPLLGPALQHQQIVLSNQGMTTSLPPGAPPLRNFLGLPIRFDNRLVGLIGLGNRTEGYDEQMVQLLEPLVMTLGTLFHARDQESARASAERELLRLASRDTLTGLANRRSFFETAEISLVQARRYGTPLTVALLDLDHFKVINDTHGHATGDAVLRRFADILCETLRDSDTPARIGGEEFAVLLPCTSIPEALTALERIRHRLSEQPIEVGSHVVHVTVSIGTVQWDPAHLDVDAMLAHADAALYEAKHLGRNRIQLYRPAPHAVGGQDRPIRAANDAA